MKNLLASHSVRILALASLFFVILSSCSPSKNKSLESGAIKDLTREEVQDLAAGLMPESIREKSLKGRSTCNVTQMIPMMDSILQSQTCNLCEVLAFEALINCENCASNPLFLEHIASRQAQYRTHVRNICFSKPCLEADQANFLVYMWQNSSSDIIACMNLMGISTGLNSVGPAGPVATKPLVDTTVINPMLGGLYNRFCGGTDLCPRPVGHKCDEFVATATDIANSANNLNHCSALELFSRMYSISSDYCSCVDSGQTIPLISSANEQEIRTTLSSIYADPNFLIKYCLDPKTPEQGTILRNVLEGKRIGCGLSTPVPSAEFVHKFMCNGSLCEPRTCACNFPKAEARCNGAAEGIQNRPNTPFYNMTSLLTMHSLVTESNYCYCPTTTPVIDQANLINKLTALGVMGPGIQTYCQNQQFDLIRQKLNTVYQNSASSTAPSTYFNVFSNDFISRLCQNKFCPDYE